MKRITSFTVNHDYIIPGIYLSRKDGDIDTYDLRTRKPNGGEYMDNLTMHSLEHMFATFVRNSEKSDQIIYFGPMGCQTGFYLLVRDMSGGEVLALVKETLEKIIAYEGEVFGASRVECGNYQNLALEPAKAECRAYLKALNEYENIDFKYKGEE